MLYNKNCIDLWEEFWIESLKNVALKIQKKKRTLLQKQQKN